MKALRYSALPLVSRLALISHGQDKNRVDIGYKAVERHVAPRRIPDDQLPLAAPLTGCPMSGLLARICTACTISSVRSGAPATSCFARWSKKRSKSSRTSGARNIRATSPRLGRHFAGLRATGLRGCSPRDRASTYARASSPGTTFPVDKTLAQRSSATRQASGNPSGTNVPAERSFRAPGAASPSRSTTQ